MTTQTEAKTYTLTTVVNKGIEVNNIETGKVRFVLKACNTTERNVCMWSASTPGGREIMRQIFMDREDLRRIKQYFRVECRKKGF